MIACEQALLFGPAKRVARASGEASHVACHSRVYFLRYPPNGKLARRLNKRKGLDEILSPEFFFYQGAIAENCVLPSRKVSQRLKPNLVILKQRDFWIGSSGVTATNVI